MAFVGSSKVNFSQHIKWKPQEISSIKLNSDGSVMDQTAAAGFVIRGHQGQPIFARAKNFGRLDFLITKASTRSKRWFACCRAKEFSANWSRRVLQATN